MWGTGIILKLDVMEGREANQRKDFSQEYGEETAAHDTSIDKGVLWHWKSIVCRLRLFICEGTISSSRKGTLLYGHDKNSP